MENELFHKEREGSRKEGGAANISPSLNRTVFKIQVERGARSAGAGCLEKRVPRR